MHPRPSPGTTHDNQRHRSLRGSLDQSRQSFADHRAHTAHDEGRIGDSERDSTSSNHTGARQCRVIQAGPFLFGNQAIGVSFLVAESERIGRLEIGVPFFKRPIVKDLIDAFPS